jgi:steroid 5-alpha reductase family enzyme
LWLITIAGWWSLTTVLSPLLMTYFLLHVTGARLTEKYMTGRPGFDEYKARASFFVPRPPRCTPRSAQNDDRRR